MWNDDYNDSDDDDVSEDVQSAFPSLGRTTTQPPSLRELDSRSSALFRVAAAAAVAAADCLGKPTACRAAYGLSLGPHLLLLLSHTYPVHWPSWH